MVLGVPERLVNGKGLQNVLRTQKLVTRGLTELLINILYIIKTYSKTTFSLRNEQFAVAFYSMGFVQTDHCLGAL